MSGGGSTRYWRRVRRLTGVLLLAWGAVTLVGPWFARELYAFTVFGFPLSFWLASQGALLLYIVIIAAYALLMDRLDRSEAAHHDPARQEPTK